MKFHHRGAGKKQSLPCYEHCKPNHAGEGGEEGEIWRLRLLGLEFHHPTLTSLTMHYRKHCLSCFPGWLGAPDMAFHMGRAREWHLRGKINYSLPCLYWSTSWMTWSSYHNYYSRKSSGFLSPPFISFVCSPSHITSLTDNWALAKLAHLLIVSSH